MRIREVLLWLVLLALVMVLGWVISAPARPAAATRITFSEFLSRVAAGQIASVEIVDQDLVATSKINEKFATQVPGDSRAYLPKLLEQDVQINLASRSQHGIAVRLFLLYTSTVLPWFTLLLVVLAWLRVRSLEKRLAGQQGKEPE